MTPAGFALLCILTALLAVSLYNNSDRGGYAW